MSELDETTEIVLACPVCNGDPRESKRDAAYLGLLEPFSIQRCRACSFRWMSPRPTPASYSELYEFAYHGGAGSSSAPWFDSYPPAPSQLRRNSPQQRQLVDSQHDMYLRLLSDHLTPGAKLLEVGCSDGAFLTKARNSGWSVTGLEPSRTAADRARDRGLEVMCGDLSDLPATDPRYDAVFLGHVFEHLTSPAESASQLRRLLKPAGVLVMEVPNQFASARSLAKRVLNYAGLRPAKSSIFSIHHPNFFDPQSMRSTLETAGFTDIRIRTKSPRASRAISAALDSAVDQLSRGHFVQVVAFNPE